VRCAIAINAVFALCHRLERHVASIIYKLNMVLKDTALCGLLERVVGSCANPVTGGRAKSFDNNKCNHKIYHSPYD